MYFSCVLHCKLLVGQLAIIEKRLDSISEFKMKSFSKERNYFKYSTYMAIRISTLLLRYAPISVVQTVCSFFPSTHAENTTYNLRN